MIKVVNCAQFIWKKRPYFSFNFTASLEITAVTNKQMIQTIERSLFFIFWNFDMAYWFELSICSCKQMIDGVVSFYSMHAVVLESFNLLLMLWCFFIVVKDPWYNDAKSTFTPISNHKCLADCMHFFVSWMSILFNECAVYLCQNILNQRQQMDVTRA